MTVKQIRSTDGTGTLSYVLIDETTRVGLIVDPNVEDIPEISSFIQQAGIRVTHIIDTHTHVDHVSGAGRLKELYGAAVVMHENTRHKWKVVNEGDKFGIGKTLRANAGITIDRYVRDGELLATGGLSVAIMFTPGHTDNHLSLLAGENLFTGDLLLIGQAGRSDLPGGNAGEQYESLFKKIMPLPDHFRVYPGHDYAGKEYALLGDEKRTNPFLQPRTKEQYVAFTADFFPPIAESMTGGGMMTLQCGTQRVLQSDDEVNSLTPRELEELQRSADPPLILDVREPVELTMTGAIEGAVNISVRQLASRLQELPADKTTPIVCVCQSGSRSLEATHYLQRQGYANVRNLTGGTSSWIQGGFRVVRPALTVP